MLWQNAPAQMYPLTSLAQLRQQRLLAASRMSSAESGPLGHHAWGSGGEESLRHTSGVTLSNPFVAFGFCKGQKEEKESFCTLAVHHLIHVCCAQPQRGDKKVPGICEDTHFISASSKM